MIMIKPIEKQQYHKAWKSWNGAVNQSWAWGELKTHFGWEVKRVGIFENENLVAVATFFIRKTSVFKFAYIPRGIATQDIRYLDMALQELDHYCLALGIAFILLDPERNLFVQESNEIFKVALSSNGWKVAGESMQPNQTDIVNIGNGEEELLTNMKPKWRRNIRKSARQGVRISEVQGFDGVEKFYEVISSVEKNTKFKAHSLEYFEKMWEELSKDDLIKIYIAEYKDKVVASYLVLLGEKVAYEIYGGATKEGRDCEASYLLKWEIIKRLATSGKRYYDQWGAAPKDSKDHPLSGISYFKSGFGGEYMEFLPQYVKVFRSVYYLLYKMLKKLR
jgi:lipid II:glycine glycyltransferase (peptidoglycan interpeptide bridge formation enzyme)